MPKTQRVALITGGAKRVGRAIAEKLSAEGFAVAFTYHNSEADAKRLERKLPGSLAINADLTEPLTAAEHVFETFTDWSNRLDVLVNNASIYLPGDDHLREMLAIHVESPLRLCRDFERHLRKSRGHVINMIDLLAEKPWPKFAAYAASKAALASLTKSLAKDFAPQVTVNGIAPGVVEWPRDFPKAEQEKYLSRVPLARAGTPLDVAGLVHYLVTAGQYITGQIIRLDGGRSLT